MGKILFGVHNHQPVDNFHEIVERAIDRSYFPFIKEAEKHPKFKFSLHFSGWLFNYIKEKREELFKLIKKMVERGQVELFTGGYYEPILPSIPSSYRRAQIEKLNSFIKENFGITPKGLWLAERVWDEEIIKDLVECGIEYAVVDDYHFICAGFKREELNGYFLTENQGYALKVYPIDKKLRYLIPFKNLGEIEKYLKGTWGTKVLFDDGEKFGLWPGTYRWVYEEGWLKEFFKAFEEGVLEGELFSENSTKEKPLGVAYLPTCSYYEMGMWSLPTDRYIEITKLKETLRKLGVEEEEFIRGSIWKNFFVKYSESNYMHKRMIQVAKEASGKKEIEEEVMKSQCNDVFWHGIFGGLYLPNLRDNFWKYLIRAEKALNKKSAQVKDIDFDGFPEIILHTKETIGVISLKDGSLLELSLKDFEVNLQNTLTRRREWYHSLKEERGKESENGIATIHEITPKIEGELKDKLAFDWHRKSSFICHILKREPSLKEAFKEEMEEVGDFANQPYQLISISENTLIIERKGGIYINDTKYPATLKKTFTLEASRLKAVIELKTEYLNQLTFGTEINLHFQNPKPTIVKLNRGIKVKDEPLEVSIFHEGERVIYYPIETVHQVEKGAESTIQGTSFLILQKVKAGKLKTEITLEVKNV